MKSPPNSSNSAGIRFPEPLAQLTTLSFSGGRQSTWILESILRGEMDRPESFMVVTADPGAEKQETIKRVREYRARCADAGILFVIADGPDIAEDLLAMQNGTKSRIDNPPMWTRAKGDEIPDPEDADETLLNHPQGATFAMACLALEQPELFQPTKKQLDSKGQLTQCCTKYYKVVPNPPRYP